MMMEWAFSHYRCVCVELSAVFSSIPVEFSWFDMPLCRVRCRQLVMWKGRVLRFLVLVVSEVSSRRDTVTFPHARFPFRNCHVTMVCSF